MPIKIPAFFDLRFMLPDLPEQIFFIQELVIKELSKKLKGELPVEDRFPFWLFPGSGLMNLAIGDACVAEITKGQTSPDLLLNRIHLYGMNSL